MNEFFAGVILAVWLVFFVFLSWNANHRPFFNITMGILSFILCGAFYLVPFWLLFMR